jgi:RNAse (barnase) inhibitor barstar
MKEIVLDSAAWHSAEDFFHALLPELDAPGWHGHNLNALYDSLAGGINEVEPPFRVIVQNAAHLSEDMVSFLAGVSAVFADARREFGVDVAFEVI